MEDVVALESIPLLGWKVADCPAPVDGFDPALLLQISHMGSPTLVFKADTIESKER